MGLINVVVDTTTAVIDWTRDLGGDVFNAPGSGSGPGGGNSGGAGGSGAGGGGGSGPGRRGGRAPTIGELIDLGGEAMAVFWDALSRGTRGDPDGLADTVRATVRNAALENTGQRIGNTPLTTGIGTGIDVLVAGPAIGRGVMAAGSHNRRNRDRGLNAPRRERDLATPSSGDE